MGTPFHLAACGRRWAALALALATAAGVLAACDSATPAATPAPSRSSAALPNFAPVADPGSIDLLHLADEPPPPADHVVTAVHGLTVDFVDPNGWYGVSLFPGTVTAPAVRGPRIGGYIEPVSAQLSSSGPRGDVPEVDALVLPDLVSSVDPADVQRRVLSWFADRLRAAGTGPATLVGQRTGLFRNLPAQVFKLGFPSSGGPRTAKAITLVYGRTVFVLSDISPEDPLNAFDAFVVSFHLLGPSGPSATPSLPPPSSIGNSPSPSVTATPGGGSPGASGTPIGPPGGGLGSPSGTPLPY